MSEIRVATRQDLPDLAIALAEAFTDDPVMDWMLPALPSKERLFRALLKYKIPLGHVYTVPSRKAAIIWSPPGQWKLPISAMLRQAAPLARAAGIRLPRMLGRLGELERLHEKVRPEHWYVNTIGTADGLRGKGIGSMLLEHGLANVCQARPVYLESTNRRNLSFYKRHGFQVIGEPPMKSGPPQWTLWRD